MSSSLGDTNGDAHTPTSESSNGSNSKSVTVHHLRRSQSERIVWLCEEMKDVLPHFSYNLVLHHRDPETACGPQILGELHPAGTAPVLVDETCDPKQVIGESQAIVEYLLNRHGQGKWFTVSRDHPEYGEYLSWYNFANGSLQANMTKLGTIDMLIRSFKKMQSAKGAEPAEMGRDLDQIAGMFKRRLGLHFGMIDQRLQSTKYLAGEQFTAADIMTVFSLTTMRAFYPVDLSVHSNILRYLQDIAQRPAYLRALKLAEPGMEPMIAARVPGFEFGVFKD